MRFIENSVVGYVLVHPVHVKVRTDRHLYAVRFSVITTNIRYAAHSTTRIRLRLRQITPGAEQHSQMVQVYIGLVSPFVSANALPWPENNYNM